MKNYIDCEFDGHLGKLISFAIIREDNTALYAVTSRAIASDPWVSQHVMPYLDSHTCPTWHNTDERTLGVYLREFIGKDSRPTIISDSMADIHYFVKLMSTDHNGNYKPLGRKGMDFVVENVRAYPSTLEGLTRHNAYCDALALKHKLENG